jgi:SAM-dependent methyltransferase
MASPDAKQELSSPDASFRVSRQKVNDRPLMLDTHMRGLRRKLRWWRGQGWRAEDFAARYAAGGADAWGYRGSDLHARRADLILAALPQPRFSRALEVGCAQGFLSERLAARCDRLIACDLSALAVRTARDACRAHPQAEFHEADIRGGFPGDGFDLLLFSDVLYYLAPREIDAVLAEAGAKSAPGAALVVANEWDGKGTGLTPPAHALARLDADPRWRSLSRHEHPLGSVRLSLSVYALA